MADLAPTSRPVGRNAELTRVWEHLDAVGKGFGRTVAVVGQPGFGKTSILAAAIERARDMGFTVLSGRAWPLDANLSYAPILDAVGPWLRQLPDDQRRRLVRDLGDLGRLFADLRLPPPPSLGDPALEKTRLFEAVTRLLERAATSAPVALVVDDVHTADRATIELLAYLLRRVTHRPILVVLSWRSGERTRLSGIESTLNALERSRVAEKVLLGPLDRDALAELARDRLGGEAPVEVLDWLVERSGGSAFFAVALLRLFRREGPVDEVPPEVEDFIADLLVRVAPPRRTLLQALAIAGDPVAWEVLRETTGLDDQDLVQAIERSLSSGTVTQGERDGVLHWWITHPLTQEVVYRSVPILQRQRLHRALIEVRERLAPDDLGHLARHYQGAGPQVPDPERALEVLATAGRQAAARLAADEAAQFLAAAVSLGRRLGRDDLLADLLSDLGRAWALLGERESVAALEEAASRYAAARQLDRAGEVRAELAEVLWQQGRFEAARAQVDEGIASLRGGGASPALAQLYRNGTAIWARIGEFDRIDRVVDEMASWGDTPPSLAYEVAFASLPAHMERHRLSEAVGVAARVADLAQTVEQRLHAHRVRSLAAQLGVPQGERWVDEYVDFVRELGLAALAPLAWTAKLSLYLIRMEPGRASAALDAALEAMELVHSPRDVPRLYACQAWAAYLQGDFDAGDRALTKARDAMQGLRLDAHAREGTEVPGIVGALLRGDNAEAAARARGLSMFVPPAVPWYRTEALAAAGHVDEAAAVASQLRACSTGLPFVEGVAFGASGLVAAAADRIDEAVDLLTRGIERLDSTGADAFAARLRLERARVALGTEESARADLETAHSRFVESGCRPYADQARALLRQLGVRVMAPASGRREGPLSERQWQVARLAARGRTNAEIAKALYVSPHTTKSHLKHIYATLGISSRAELTRWVLEHDPHERGA